MGKFITKIEKIEVLMSVILFIFIFNFITFPSFTLFHTLVDTIFLSYPFIFLTFVLWNIEATKFQFYFTYIFLTLMYVISTSTSVFIMSLFPLWGYILGFFIFLFIYKIDGE
jgi:hypothetical protein